MKFTLVGVCLECKKSITNPICNECISDQVKIWAFEKKIDHDFKTKTYGGTGVNCLKCKKEMQVCSECYVKEVFITIIRKNPILGTKFSETFNCELEKQ